MQAGAPSHVEMMGNCTARRQSLVLLIELHSFFQIDLDRLVHRTPGSPGETTRFYYVGSRCSTEELVADQEGPSFRISDVKHSTEPGRSM